MQRGTLADVVALADMIQKLGLEEFQLTAQAAQQMLREVSSSSSQSSSAGSHVPSTGPATA